MKKQITINCFPAGTRGIVFLANQRVEKEAELLCRTEVSIKEIAATVGYHHSSSFNRGFQKNFGVAPADFRKKHRPEVESNEQ